MTVDTIDVVPDQFKPLYVEKDGKYSIDNSDPKTKSVVEAILGFNKALRASRGEVDSLRKKTVDLSALREFGDTPEAIRAAFDAKLTELAKDPKIDIEKIKADISKGFLVEKDAVVKKAEALQGQLYNVLVENTALAAITELKGIPELIMPFVKGQVKATTEDGKFKVVIVDADNNTRYSTTTGEPMTVKEFILEMKGTERFGRLFESETKSGAGVKPTNGRPPVNQDNLSPVNKIAMGLKNASKE